MTHSRSGTSAICALWLVASFVAPAVLLTDGLFLALLFSGAIFLGLGLWATVPIVALSVAGKRVCQQRYRDAVLLLALPVLGILLGYGGGKFWWALRRATMPPEHACAQAAAGGRCLDRERRVQSHPERG
jgi:hypothetical protein